MDFSRSALPSRTAIRALVFSSLASLALAACGGGGGGGNSGGGGTPGPSGGGGGGSTPTSQTYTIGGSISGVSASGLVLQDNGGDNLSVSAGATSFTFKTPVSAGGQYSVTITSAPANTNCTATNAGGTVAAANVTNVAVTCTPITYTIGGTVSGLTGSGLVLQDNGGDNLTVASGDNTFSFATPITVGGAYAVTILAQPANQTCSVANGTGGVALAKVTNVAITCSNGYAIGGTVSGLTGSGLVLQDNGGDNLTVASGAGTFSFATPVVAGGAYAVTVLTQPANQTCSVANGTGKVAAAKVTNVAITCTKAPPTYTIGGTVIGLLSTNSTVVVQDNAGDNLSMKGGLASFQFQFATALTSGTAYSVTVLTQPTAPAKTCRVTNGTGTVGTANISNITINCLDVGLYVYVVNSTDNTDGDVSAFTIDAATGALTAVAGSPVAANKGPSAIAIYADYALQGNTLVYVSNMTSADMTTFEYAGSNGALPVIGNSSIFLPAPTTLVPESMVTGTGGSPYDPYVFIGGRGTGSQGTIAGLRLDNMGFVSATATGFDTATVTAGPVLGLALDNPASLLFATASSANLLYVYSANTDASLTAFVEGPYKTGNDPRGVAVLPINSDNTYKTGFVYTANRGDNNISAFAFDAQAATLQPATTFATGKAPVGIAIDATGTYLYSANSGDGTVSAFSINPTTGALTSLGAAVASGNLNPTANANNPGPIDIKVDPSGQFVYCVNGNDGSVSLFTVKAGALTLSKTYPTGTGAKALAIY
jgi:6-phosphogluconolactonase (cycloisomerase 2 family)